MSEYGSAEILEDSKLPFWRKRRYHVVLMVFFGLFNLFTLRINLSVAIVAMTEKINVTLEDGSVVERQEYFLAGSFGCLWYLAWLFIVRANPEVDPFIKEAEKQFILSSIGDRSQVKNIRHPWKDILTSMPVWAIIVASFSSMWGSHTLFTQLPMFLNVAIIRHIIFATQHLNLDLNSITNSLFTKDTLNFNVGTTGIMASIPYMVLTCLLFFTGFFADWLLRKGHLRTGQVRRYFNCGAFVAQMTFMLLTAFTTDPVLSVVFISLGVGAGAFTSSGYKPNMLDLAPSHASVLMGLANTFGALPGVISPIVTGFIVTDKTKEQWQIVFYIAAGIYLFGCIFYWFFVRGRLQPWAKIDIEELANRNALKERKKLKTVE
ncbi:vesicular glutamate transporter 1-like [Phlebotomus argentipes]|uniref:vesicular glutamate transporter 1-like n=1 Tax=Phlebotomus argentipes TaxID=94469 RepID=UPI002892AA1C|nr:vesicular glutamate transporter 1-like [Phlebotomus argentipes]